MPSPLGYPFILFSPVSQAGGNVLGCKNCVNVGSWRRPAKAVAAVLETVRAGGQERL